MILTSPSISAFSHLLSFESSAVPLLDHSVAYMPHGIVLQAPMWTQVFLTLCHYTQAAMDVLEQGVLCTWMSPCERYIPRGEIAESRACAFFMLMDLAKLLSRAMKPFTNPPAIMRRSVSAHPQQQTILPLIISKMKNGISLGELLKIKSHPASPPTHIHLKLQSLPLFLEQNPNSWLQTWPKFYMNQPWPCFQSCFSPTPVPPQQSYRHPGPV